jgi:hypothetical protein
MVFVIERKSYPREIYPFLFERLLQSASAHIVDKLMKRNFPLVNFNRYVYLSQRPGQRPVKG